MLSHIENKNRYNLFKKNKPLALSSFRKRKFLKTYMLMKLYSKLKKNVPDKVLEKILFNSKKVFSYFNDCKIEEIYIFIKKEKLNWKIEFKVYPSYKDDNEKKIIEIIEFYSSNNEKYLVNLKHFYLTNLKQILI